jgi:hypothetical protein
MAQTYENALLNISADASSDANGGCFVDREPQDITPIRISSTKLQRGWDLTPDSWALFSWMWQAPTFSRAWIYRERQLARRILHFTNKELVWECCGTGEASFASEMFPGGLQSKALWNLDVKYHSGRLQQGLVEGAEETYAMWNDLCESLSSKNLTVPTDMPMILSSLAEQFASALPSDSYVAGHWRSTLPRSLLWEVQGTLMHDVENPLPYIAPSWSWLSLDWPVKQALRAGLKNKLDLALLDEVSLQHATHSQFGLLKYGSLQVEAILRRIRITELVPLDLQTGTTTTRNTSLAVWDPDGEENENDDEMRVIGKLWDEDEGEMARVRFDRDQQSSTVDCFCLFIQLNQWGSCDHYTRELGCILLQRRADETYHRIGVLFLNVLFAFKMAYCPALESEEPISEESWKSWFDRIKERQGTIYNYRQILEAKKHNGEAVSEQEEENLKVLSRTLEPGAAALYFYDEVMCSEEMREELHDKWDRLDPQTVVIV